MIKSKFVRKILVGWGLMAFLSCNPQESKIQGDRLLPSRLIQLLHDPLERTAREAILLDTSKTEIVYPNLVIGDGSSMKAIHLDVKTLQLISPCGTVVVRDSIYICDRTQRGIFVANTNGIISRLITQTESMREEFLEPSSIDANDKTIVVYDGGKGQVQLYTRFFRYVGSFPARLGVFGSSVSVGGSKLFVQTGPSDSFRVAIHEQQPPFRKTRSVLSIKVSEDDVLMSLNHIFISANKKDELCVGFSSMPYLFVFDSSGKQVTTLELRGHLVSDLYRSPQKKDGSDASFTVVRTFLNGLLMCDDGRILIATGPYIFVVKRENDGYALRRSFKLHHNSKGSDFSMSQWRLNMVGGNLYVSVGSKSMVLRLTLTDD